MKAQEKGTLTVAPAGTTRGTLNEIVAVMRWSGFPLVRDSIVAVPTVIRVAVDAWFVTVMRPTSLPSGPLGWTTFWTLARIVRFASSNTLTVMRRRPGEARAVPSRRTLRIGSGNRYLFRPHGAFAKVWIVFDDISLSPNRPKVPSFEGEDPRAILDGFAGDITVPMHAESVWSLVDLDCDRGNENLRHSLARATFRQVQNGNENPLSFPSDFENVGKTLIAAILPSG